ncbi:MAG: LTA synthase family protein [bacterium]|nr:LTA synthase family protein [bacterium]
MSEKEPNQTVEEARAADFVLLTLAMVVSPLAFRGLQAAHANVSIGYGDVRGLLADLGLALALAGLVAGANLLLGRTRALAVAVPLVALWVFGNNANLEHVRNLGTLLGAANIAFLFDDTFVSGSATHLSHPLALALLFAATAAAGFASTRRRFDGHRATALVAIGAVVLGLRLALPAASDAATWRQTHFVLENLRWLTSAGGTAVAAPERPIPGLFPATLDGQAILPLDHRGENVLLVVLEGVSGAYVDRLAAMQGLDGERPRLPSLDRASRRGVTLVNFANQQRQTNRGLYALVCGDLPKQTTAAPKMSDVGAIGQDAECLPRALARNGYATAFLQSAPLSFMAKDKFMPFAGFERFHGIEFFDASSEKQAWGVDDRAFLQQSMRLIDELDRGEKPWFLTLLSSGTHHPFHVPTDLLEEGEVPSFSRAIEYLDFALDEFLSNLEREGVLEDTVVVLTSDESFGLDTRSGDLSDPELMLSQAWGVLVTLLPSGEQMDVTTPTSQTDVAVSILDLLGLQHETRHFRGRSVFREYAQPRAVPFANTYMRMSALAEADDTLLFCSEDRSDCERARLTNPPFLFAGHERIESAVPTTDPGRALLARIQARSLELPVLQDANAAQKRIEYALIETPSTMILDADHFREELARTRSERNQQGRDTIDFLSFQPVFANQYLALPKGYVARVEIEAEVKGNVPLDLYHSLRAVPLRAMPSTAEYRSAAAAGAEIRGLSDTFGMRPRFLERTVDLALTGRSVAPDEPFVLVYEYSAAEDFERLNARMGARNDLEGIAGLVLRRAQLTIEPLPEGQAPRGLEILEYSHRNDRNSVAARR